MPSVLSRVGAPQLLGGLVVGVGLGVAVAGKLLRPPLPDVDKSKALEAEKAAALKELLFLVQDVEAERDQAYSEIEKLRVGSGAPKGATELEAMKGLDEMDARHEKLKEVASAEQQTKTLQDKVKLLEAQVRREANQGAKASARLDDMRKRGVSLAAERDSAFAQAKEAQHKVTTLEEEQASLQTELASSNKKRKDSMTNITRGLSDISAKLDTAQTSFMPWQEIVSVKQQVGKMQKETVKDEDLVLGG